MKGDNRQKRLFSIAPEKHLTFVKKVILNFRKGGKERNTEDESGSQAFCKFSRISSSGKRKIFLHAGVRRRDDYQAGVGQAQDSGGPADGSPGEWNSPQTRRSLAARRYTQHLSSSSRGVKVSPRRSKNGVSIGVDAN